MPHEPQNIALLLATVGVLLALSAVANRAALKWGIPVAGFRTLRAPGAVEHRPRRAARPQSCGYADSASLPSASGLSRAGTSRRSGATLVHS